LERTNVEDELQALKPEALGSDTSAWCCRQSAPMPLLLISSRLLKHPPHDKKFERQVRMQGRTLLQQMSDKSLSHPFTEEEISAAL